ncbi:MAG: chromate transporter [Rikenellaceae bacterium]
MFSLFTTFFKIGLFTFGGGWAMIPAIEKEVVDIKKWLSKEEFLDALVISQSLPGILAVNISILVGQKRFGQKGSLIATLGTVLPSFILILLIAMFFVKIYDNPIVVAIFKGIRPAVVALIIAPVLSTAKSAKIGWRTVWIPGLIALLVWQWGISPVYLILVVVAIGLTIQYFKSRKA